MTRLPGDLDDVEELKLGFVHVDMLVEGGALAPLSDDGQNLFRGDTAHEEENIGVSITKKKEKKERIKNVRKLILGTLQLRERRFHELT